MDHALEVPFPQFRDVLSACLSVWHLCTPYCSRFSWVFPNSDGIQQRPRAGCLAGALGSLGQPEHCSSERAAGPRAGKGITNKSKGEINPPLSPVWFLCRALWTLVWRLFVSLNIFWNASFLDFRPKLHSNSFLARSGLNTSGK